MFCSDRMSGSYFIVQTSKFLLINATAVTFGHMQASAERVLS